MPSPFELLEQWLRDDPERWQRLNQIRTAEVEMRLAAGRLYLAAGGLYLAAGKLYLAAGAVRNLVWDNLHQYSPSPLNDVDVIFYAPLPPTRNQQVEQHLFQTLKTLNPRANWQVKNQAHMHHRNGDPAYANLSDAMSYWPEKETAIAVRLTSEDKLEVVAPFGINSLMSGELNWNSKRDQQVFRQRLEQKAWQRQWPKLKVNTE